VDLDLAELTRRHTDAWTVLFRRAGRILDVRAASPVRGRASPGAIGQVLDVLLENALTHGAGRTSVSLEDDGRRVTLAIEDEGAGVSADVEHAIFERGASDGGGSGIGLHLAQVLSVAEGGQLRLARPSPPRFELVLPRGSGPVARVTPRE
jgi:signal transduction histidine kinase